MIENHKILLIGPAASKSFTGRYFYTGANYYYLLATIGILSRWQPLIITGVFIIIEFIFYIFFTLFLKKLFSTSYALSVFLFTAVSPYLVIHSRFFWNPHLLIPISILTLFFLIKYYQNKLFRHLFYAGVLWGFAFACHYTAVFWLAIFLFTLFKTKQFSNIKSHLLIISGFFLGNLPLIIFELRHGFYNLKTMIYIFTHSSQALDLTSHYFVFSLLIFSLFGILLIFQRYKLAYLHLLTVFSLLILVQIKIFHFYQPLGAISGWDYSTQNAVADFISKDCPQNFNVAATMQGDTRFYDLRYLLNLKHCPPQVVDAYPASQKLFLVSPISRIPQSETVWEVSAFKPFKIKNLYLLNNYLILYDLEKK